MPTARELEEMARDYERMDRDRITEICKEVMKEELFEAELAKEELRLLKEGAIVVLPKDLEHARAMFKVSCFYLSQYDLDFKLRMEK